MFIWCKEGKLEWVLALSKQAWGSYFYYTQRPVFVISTLSNHGVCHCTVVGLISQPMTKKEQKSFLQTPATGGKEFSSQKLYHWATEASY